MFTGIGRVRGVRWDVIVALIAAWVGATAVPQATIAEPAAWTAAQPAQTSQVTLPRPARKQQTVATISTIALELNSLSSRDFGDWEHPSPAPQGAPGY